MGKKESKYTKIVLETYNELFKASEPQLDFNNYINTTCNYVVDSTGEKVVLPEHLSLDEMRNRGLRIDVPFENHFIGKQESEDIIDNICKKYKLTKRECSSLRFQVYLGCAPTFKKEKNKAAKNEEQCD